MQRIDTNLLNGVTAQAKESPRVCLNYIFHGFFEELAQRLLFALVLGTVLPVHRHPHTSETYLLLRGKIRVMFYNDAKEETESTVLDPLTGDYGVHIPAGQWHTLEVLESGSVLFEVKDGPYTPLGEDDLLI